MMKHEFEQIAGYEVSYEDYTNIIEPMYMATNLSKKEFVQTIDRKRFDIKAKMKKIEKQLRKELKELAEQMKAECGHVGTLETFEKLQSKAREYRDTFPMYGTEVDFERATGYGNCRYIKALVWYDSKTWKEVKRVELVA